ncbi:MAG: hypothetical protein CV045_02355 [Cyanobacteria bacterium M5B4]|nr:hypothetical protein [Cyanobacteria bacterium KgW148]PLS69418.1 MAG: hypothetical protein CV045_02355 [Cyanobacteria bacterium M5B4]
MTPENIKDQVRAIVLKRQVLVQLSQKDNLGNLKIDVQQALAEMEDLIQEFNRTFPDCALPELQP